MQTLQGTTRVRRTRYNWGVWHEEEWKARAFKSEFLYNITSRHYLQTIVNMRVECADTLRISWSWVPCVCSFIQEVRFEHLRCAGCICFRCWDFSGSTPHSVGSIHYRWASIKSSPQYVMESAWGWSGKASWRSDAVKDE